MITLTEEQFKEMIEAAHRAGQHNQGHCDPSAYEAMVYYELEVKKLNIPAVMPRISHFIDENGNSVNINAGGVNVVLKRDGTHEYFRSFGFAGRMQLTPVYVA